MKATYLPCTNTDSWMDGRKMFRHTSAKQKNAQTQARLHVRTNRWSKVQADARCPSSKKQFTAPLNNIRTLKFKAQATYAFFATVNQTFRGSSLVPTTAERVEIKSLSAVQTTKQCSEVVGSWEQPSNIWLTVAKNAFVGWVLIRRRQNSKKKF